MSIEQLSTLYLPTRTVLCNVLLGKKGQIRVRLDSFFPKPLGFFQFAFVIFGTAVILSLNDRYKCTGFEGVLRNAGTTIPTAR